MKTFVILFSEWYGILNDGGINDRPWNRKKLLDQVLEEVRSLKSIIQSEDSVVGKKVPAPENTHTNVPVLWYDELNFGSENPDYYDDQSL